MLEIDVSHERRKIVTLNVDLKPGSSKHGKAFLAFVGWNCVATRYLAKERGAKGVILFRYACL